VAVNSVPSATSGRIILTDGPSGLEQLIRKTQSGSVATVVSFDDRWLNKSGPLDLCLRRNIFHNPAEPFLGDSKDPGTSTISAAGPLWSEDETLRLLEGLERFGDNWTDVQRHVASDKSVEQCIAHFLQMPIEDAYLDDQFRVKPAAAATTQAAAAQRSPNGKGASAAKQALPFEAAGNPVLAQIAFLNSCGAGPEVAAAAAAAALEVFVKAAQEDSKSGEEDSKGEAMDLDSSEEPSAQKAAEPDPEKDPKGDVTKEELESRAAAAAGIAAAAAQSKKLADVEGDEVRVLVVKAVQKQLEKLKLKMKQFEEVEKLMDTQRQEIERDRAALAQARLALTSRRANVRATATIAPSEGSGLSTAISVANAELPEDSTVQRIAPPAPAPSQQVAAPMQQTAAQIAAQPQQTVAPAQPAEAQPVTTQPDPAV